MLVSEKFKVYSRVFRSFNVSGESRGITRFNLQSVTSSARNEHKI